MSLIIHYGDSFGCEHYFSDIFVVNKGILGHRGDDVITENSDLSEGVYSRESNKIDILKERELYLVQKKN